VKPELKPEPAPPAQKQEARTSPAKPAPPETVAAVAPAPKRNRAEEEAALTRFGQEISRQIGSKLSGRDYPSIARERKWQGTTHLTLRFEADGKLADVVITTSSGYEVLDKRAVELMRRVKLPVVPAEVQSRAFSVRVPVQFALRD
jgi:protein TonB